MNWTTLRLSRSDINDGESESTRCPVALMLRRHCKGDVCVDGLGVEVGNERVEIDFVSSLFIAFYDLTGIMFTFSLRVPTRWLKPKAVASGERPMDKPTLPSRAEKEWECAI